MGVWNWVLDWSFCRNRNYKSVDIGVIIKLNQTPEATQGCPTVDFKDHRISF